MDDACDDAHEAVYAEGYAAGSRMAWLDLLREALHALGYADASQAVWVVEREEAIQVLRGLCRQYGDNEWPGTLALADIVEKHLGRYLDARNMEGGGYATPESAQGGQ